MSEVVTRPASVSARPVGSSGSSKPRRRELRSAADNFEARSQMLLAAMLAFRDGDFSWRLPSDWADTEGRIAEAFNQTIAHEDRISREVERLSMTVGRDGRLKQRMSLPGAIGQWATKVDSINTLIDDLVRPTAEIARTIGAVAKGDLGQSMELEADGRGAQGRVPPLGEARQYDDRAALGVHLGGDPRRARGRHRGQARRPGAGQGRLGRVEGSDRLGQSDGRQSHRSGAQHRRSHHRGRQWRPFQEDHRRRARRNSAAEGSDQHDGRSAAIVRLGSDARRARGRHRRPLGRTGRRSRRRGHLEGPHRLRQRDGDQPHRAGPQHRDRDHRRGARRSFAKDHRRRERRNSGAEGDHQHDGRSAQRLLVGSHARRARGRHRGQARRPGGGAGRRRHLEGPHRQRQLHGLEPDRPGPQYRRRGDGHRQEATSPRRSPSK